MLLLTIYPLFKKKLTNKFATPNNISVYYQNVHSPTTKFETLIRNIKISQLRCNCTETWLSCYINDSKLGLCFHYIVYRCDRYEIHGPDIRRGCVLIAVKV